MQKNKKRPAGSAARQGGTQRFGRGPDGAREAVDRPDARLKAASEGGPLERVQQDARVVGKDADLEVAVQEVTAPRPSINMAIPPQSRSRTYWPVIPVAVAAMSHVVARISSFREVREGERERKEK